MKPLLQKIAHCQECSNHLEFGPRPVLTAHKESKIVIIGQAPGAAVHKSGIPWDDKSGKNLRDWLNIDNETFYNPKKRSLITMSFKSTRKRPKPLIRTKALLRRKRERISRLQKRTGSSWTRSFN